MMLLPFLTGCILAVGAQADTFVLRPGGSVWDVAAVELNGDGRMDVAAFCCDESSDPLDKYIAVFLMNEDGGYPARPSLTLPVDPNTGAAFFAQVDGEGPKDIVVVEQGGARCYRYGPGGFEDFAGVEFVSLFPTGSKEPLFLKDAASDLDGDGVDEWLIPVPGGYELWRADGRIKRLPCHVASEVRRFGSTSVSNRLPAHRVFDVPGEEQKGLAFLSDEFADFYSGKDWSRHERFRVPVSLDQKWEASAKMEDIDGDGLPDLIVTQTQGTIRLKVLTHIYMSSAPFEYPDVPSATFETTGAITNPILRDVDGDGRLDLVLISLPFGVRTLVNYFLRGKLSIDGVVHLYDDGFSPEPSFRTRLSLDAPEGRERVAFTFGDFTGDGRLDAVYGTQKDELSVFEGSEREFLASRPWVTLSLPAFGDAKSCDLNGNERKDLLIFHPGGANRTRIDAILF